MDELMTQGPGTQDLQFYTWQIAAILLGAFILGYWFRWLINSKYKSQIKDLEDENAILRAKSVPEPVDTSDLESKISNQNQQIKELNTKLSDCYSAKLKAENALVAAKNENAQLSASKAPVAQKITENKTADKPIIAKTSASKEGADDLKKIEGVGPKIAELLSEGGIKTFDDLANAQTDRIKEILYAAGANYAVHDPTTWPNQALLASAGEWEKLKELQDELKGGKKA
jgi:predicted flap endonuclease-1-like 5' DNA nuclease